jgi:phosphoribosylformimino-5-aminoimidazole carboxamide ribotide isomerase
VKVLFAMDLMGGKSVRLKKGDFTQVTVYSENPVEKIEEMRDRGARDFHIIDLDGASRNHTAHTAKSGRIYGSRRRHTGGR